MSGMKKRNIHLKIHNKISKWIESLPLDLQAQVKKDVIVTGGCITSMLLGEQVNDYDVYFKTKDTVIKVAEHYVREFLETHPDMKIEVEQLTDTRGRERVRIFVKSAGVAEDVEVTEDMDVVKPSEVAPFRPVFLSSNAITLADDVQVIIRFWGDHEEIHKNFDFVHCMNWWSFSNGVELMPEALEAILSKTLVYRGSLYPVCSVFRTKKFIQRGWQINAGQYLKMCLQISELDLRNRAVLEEQLTGVDAAYFSHLLGAAFGDRQEIDMLYLVEVINRMFD